MFETWTNPIQRRAGLGDVANPEVKAGTVIRYEAAIPALSTPLDVPGAGEALRQKLLAAGNVRDVIVDGNKWPFIPGTLVVQVTAATDFAYLKDVQNLISGTVVYGSDFSIDETSIKTRTLNAPTVTGGSTNVIVSTQQPDARPVTTTDLDTPGRCGTWDIACHLGLSPGAAAGTGLLTGALLVLGAIIVLRKL